MSNEQASLGMKEHALLDQLEGDQWTLDQLQIEYLRVAGWQYTCDFPDHCWRWKKDVRGVVLAVSKSDAISIQKALNPRPEDESGE